MQVLRHCVTHYRLVYTTAKLLYPLASAVVREGGGAVDGLTKLVASLGGEILAADDFESLLPSLLGRIGSGVEASGVRLRILGGDDLHSVEWSAQPSTTFDSVWPGALAEGLHVYDHETPLCNTGGRFAVSAVVCLPAQWEHRVELAVGFSGTPRTEILEALPALASTLALGASRGELQHAAAYDPGTGVFNRRQITLSLRTELQRAQRFGTALTVMILDLDHFKEVNDRWGHLAGDKLLTKVGRILRECVRNCDIVGRYGGDEFLLLLPATTVAGARQVADRIGEQARTLGVGSGKNRKRIGFSGGVAAANPRSTPRSLLAAADKRLYRAKDRGRNQITFPNRSVLELSPQLSLLQVAPPVPFVAALEMERPPDPAS